MMACPQPAMPLEAPPAPPAPAALAANVLNVGLEVALIFGLGLGVRGAALAVGLGQARGLARGGVWEAAQ